MEELIGIAVRQGGVGRKIEHSKRRVTEIQERHRLNLEAFMRVLEISTLSVGCFLSFSFIEKLKLVER